MQGLLSTSNNPHTYVATSARISYIREQESSHPPSSSRAVELDDPMKQWPFYEGYKNTFSQTNKKRSAMAVTDVTMQFALNVNVLNKLQAQVAGFECHLVRGLSITLW